MNTVSLTGRLTKDIDLKYTQNGTAVGRFILAVNRRVKQEGQPDADFINCQVWKKPAEILAQYTTKGTLIGVTGRIQTGSYENQQGQRVYTTDVVVEGFDFLETKGATQQNGISSQPKQTKDSYEMFDIQDDDLPF